MSLHRKFSPGFSRAVNHLLRSLPGVRHATGTASGPNAATTMEKLDAALNNMSHGLCMFGPDNRLLLWNDRYVKMYKLAPDRLRVGSTLDEMLEARKAAGTAYRDLGQYGSKLRIGTGLRISDFTRSRRDPASTFGSGPRACFAGNASDRLCRAGHPPHDTTGLSASPLRPLTKRPAASWWVCLSGNECPFPCR
jgi:PAS domain-containing protein